MAQKARTLAVTFVPETFPAMAAAAIRAARAMITKRA